jgi:hypothetical protein
LRQGKEKYSNLWVKVLVIFGFGLGNLGLIWVLFGLIFHRIIPQYPVFSGIWAWDWDQVPIPVKFQEILPFINNSNEEIHDKDIEFDNFEKLVEEEIYHIKKSSKTKNHDHHLELTREEKNDASNEYICQNNLTDLDQNSFDRLYNYRNDRDENLPRFNCANHKLNLVVRSATSIQ